MTIKDLVTMDYYYTSAFEVAGKALSAALLAVSIGIQVAVMASFLGPVGTAAGAVVTLTAGVVGVLVDVFKPSKCEVIRDRLGFQDGTTSMQDDLTRAMVLEASCPRLQRIGLGKHGMQKLQSMLGSLMHMWTGEREQDAMFKTVRCMGEWDPMAELPQYPEPTPEMRAAKAKYMKLSKEAPSFGDAAAVRAACPGFVYVRDLISAVGMARILGNVDFKQDRAMRQLMKDCGMLSVESQGDTVKLIQGGCRCETDASCGFVRRVDSGSCTPLDRLAVQDVQQMMINLLDRTLVWEGAEEAFLKLWRCLSATERRAVLDTAETSYAVVHASIDGARWTQAKACIDLAPRDVWSKDTWVRAFVQESGCAGLREAAAAPGGVNDMVKLIKRLMKNWTSEEDQAAIVKIVECSTCELLAAIYAQVGISEFLSNLGGAHEKSVKQRFAACNLISFDSHAEIVAYVTNACPVRTDSSCDVISVQKTGSCLDLVELYKTFKTNYLTLVRNLLRGITGEAEEDALVKLIKALPRSERIELQRSGQLSYSELQSNIGGRQWGELSSCLVIPRNCYSRPEDPRRYVLAPGRCTCSNWIATCSEDHECPSDDSNPCTGICACGRNWMNECKCIKEAPKDAICSSPATLL